MKHELFIFGFSAIFILFISCEEKLPLKIPPADVAEPVLEMTSDFAENTLPYKGEASNGILFKVGIKNIFDETFYEKPYIDGHCNCYNKRVMCGFHIF